MIKMQDFAMYSDEGNREVKQAVENVIERFGKFWGNDYDKLRTIMAAELIDVEDRHPEATDTAVREKYTAAIEERLIDERQIWVRISKFFMMVEDGNEAITKREPVK